MQWRAAMADARIRAVDKLRTDTFQNAYQAWTAAADIRAFCTALEQAATNGDINDSENVARWIAWGRAAADRIDPACGTPSLADVSFDVEPRPTDLRPFLGEWSPHRPQKEYRSERDEQALADTRHQAESWHHGMLGRRTWR
ncbi:hypothetical protein GCM10010399_83770 [Dactylosporangium fulvum]|uniref:Uncharacterized protein n=1 Tax=Dactylosporangium fulvum TaxID=53359 RepID=A0ABY5VTM6_9ACTN|nr:hypothetical protein [Dactylosporangium fulvum]UWP80547.1 hypothetical protein Dfulv_36075 [Dactylosporangium fulvum]